ncbi:MAG: DegT/DnrJ/EryC1/StrS family aminotransferase [Deltaproteobacteria bacterium]|nr:DegT/DnrJ/EryC1/StrS family aminotransferase [Candidatus Zymogenaceae bacterium]
MAQSVMTTMLAGGPAVSAFETAVAHRAGTALGCAVSSGTAALHLALAALGVGPADEVILPAYVCAAPLYAVRHVGGRPILADVDPETGLSSADHIRAVLTKRTKAIVAVHLFGRAAPVDDIVSLGVPVLEDCAQSLGGECRGKPLGSWGTAAVFSFYATKVITTGFGGMVCSDDAGLIGRIRDLVRYDERTDVLTGYAYGMTSFQAALGASQMSRIDEFLQRRLAIHDFYRETFSAAGVELPPPAGQGEDIHYRFVVKSDDGVDRVISRLGERGIAARRPVFAPLYTYEETGELPGAKRAHNRDISIPLYPALTDDETRRVAEAVVAVLAGKP